MLIWRNYSLHTPLFLGYEITPPLPALRKNEMRFSQELEFNYTFVRPLDGQWGGYSEINGTGTWNGLVKDLLDKVRYVGRKYWSLIGC